MSRILKLNPPAILPSTGVTSVSFKAWQRQLTAYLEQDVNSPHFLPDGLYDTWQARGKNRVRINELHVDDPERVILMDRLTAALAARQDRPNDQRVDQYNQADRDRDLAALLQARNAQLSKFITLVSVLCPYTLTNNLDQLSTSFAWLITYLEQYYHIQKSEPTFCQSATFASMRPTPMRIFIWSFMARSKTASVNRGNSSSSVTMSPYKKMRKCHPH